MSKQLKKSIAIVVTTSLVALPVVAKPVMQKITAYLNPSIEYIVDGKAVLENAKTINYEGKNYVSVAELSKALGKEVKSQGNQVIISTPQESEKPEVADQMVIAKATIKSVDQENRQVTILADGLADKRENYLVLNVGTEKETVIRHEKNKMAYRLESLEPGMLIKVVHGSQMTMSIPPQTPAKEIIILADEKTSDVKPLPPTQEKDYELDDAIIKEINHAQKYLVVVEDGKEYKIAFTNKTKVEFEDSKKNPNVNSLKVGQEVSIEVKNGVAVEIEVED